MKQKTYTPPAGFVDLLIDAVFAVDSDAYVVFASAACERIFGYTPGEMIGRNMFDMMLPADRERTRQSVVDVMSGRPQLHFENRYVRKDGQIVHIMWATRWSPADQLRIGVARDITERKRAEAMQAVLYSISEAVHGAKDLLTLIQGIHQTIGTLLPAENFSVALYDQDTGQLSFPYFVDKYEQTPEPSKLAAGTLYAQVIGTGQALLTAVHGPAQTEGEPVSPDMNTLCWLGVPLKSHSGTIGVLVVKSYPGSARYSEKDQELLQFVSTQIATAIERQQMQARLRHMAQYDQLTGLPNRGLLYDRLKVALAAARRKQERLSLFYIDLDKFKQINDTLGHDVGDLLLQEVARRLRQCLRESDTAARIGGDEFVVLLEGIRVPEHAERIVEKIRTILSDPFVLDGHHLSIAPSIGVAHYPEHGESEQQLIKHADQAMYFAKRCDVGFTTGAAPRPR